MVNYIAQLQQLTDKIIVNIEEVTFEELEQFIAERNEIVTAMQSHLTSSDRKGFNPEDRESIQRILQHDSTIMARMTALREEAAQGLHKIKQGKTHKDTYDTVYSPESIYFDKKK